MACCGSANRTLRKQVIERPTTKKQTAVKRMSPRSQKAKSIPISRQLLVKDDRCPKCGYTIMLVNIAGRERRQCSNTQCKHVS